MLSYSLPQLGKLGKKGYQDTQVSSRLASEPAVSPVPRRPQNLSKLEATQLNGDACQGQPTNRQEALWWPASVECVFS